MHVLIIDVEFLVALESEHVLGGIADWSAEIAVSREALTVLAETNADVILIDAALLTPAVAELLEQCRLNGKGLVFSSVDSEHRHGLPGFAGVPVVLKPFDDAKLVEAVQTTSEERLRLAPESA